MVDRMIQSFEDGFNLLCGREVGRGMTRTVFDCNLRPDCVVKVENDEVRTHFQNLMEWMVWRRVCGTEFEKWFAQVVAISPNGRVLIMKKTVPHGEYPTKVPSFFTDFKRGNFGFVNGNFVCHDYGTHLLMERGMTKAMRTVNWSRLDSST
jgi:hypothetical protein